MKKRNIKQYVGNKFKLVLGDAITIMKEIEENSVDLIIADPPYNVLKKQMKYDKEWWDEFESETEYRNFTINYLIQFHRIMKEKSSCFIFWSERHLKLFLDIIKTSKFNLYKILIWHYPNITKGFSNNRWINTFDFIFHLVKGDKPQIFKPSFGKGENRDVMIFAKPQSNFKKDRKVHPTQKPLRLIMQLIKLCSNEEDIILDPFMGSGTTAVACRLLNRNFIGIEKDKSWIDTAIHRLKETPLNLEAFYD